jgi:multisubunit Na+/H+ antiporter MnhB subunit
MREFKEFLLAISMVIIVVIALAGLWIGGFYLNRWFNWKFGYESKTEETIRQMVKPEALKKI